MNIGLLCATLFLVTWEVKTQTDCITSVKQGSLRGIEFTAKKKYCAFMGIPFAEPPVGELRFKAPLPPKPWRGTREVTGESNVCMQPLQLFMRVLGSEDCLYLNVYTPDVRASGKSRLPVLVWIPPGEFYFENTYRIRNRPDFFVNNDIILVSFNYRVGAFGFLSTEDDEAPGNYGMKDQVAALKWIQENIAAFGGDPNNVTIGGVSSGAASVHYNMLSPLTKGLFQKAICQEGTAVMPWARNRHPGELAKKQARIVGCPEEPSSALVSCLRNMKPEVLTESIYKLFIFWIVPSPDFTPVVEKKTKRNPEPYLTEDPITLILNGKFHRVPWLMGSNSHPASIFTSALSSIKILRSQIQLLNKKLFPRMLMLHKSAPEDSTPAIATKVREFFNISLEYYREEELNWTNLLSDRYFIHGTHKTALLHALAGHNPIYRYHFAYRGKFSMTSSSSFKNFGVCHADELFYLFQFSFLHIGYDAEVRDLLVTLWTNFIKFGNPTPKNIDSTERSYLMEGLTWEPIGTLSNENMHIRYLNIGQVIMSPRPSLFFNQNLGPPKINMAVDLHKDRMSFWDSLPLDENVLPTEEQQKKSQRMESQSSCVEASFFIITVCGILYANVNMLMG